MDKELNWSIYQDRQLEVLRSLEKSFSESLKHSKVIGDNLTKLKTSMESMVRDTTTLANTISSLNQSSAQFSSSISGATSSLTNLSTTMNRTTTIYEQHSSILSDIDRREQDREERRQRAEDERNRRREEDEREEEERQRKFDQSLQSFLDNLSNWGKTIGKYADEYSILSNNMMKLSGASGSQVRNFREDLVQDIVADLNRDTGSFYDPQEVYKQMVSISNQTGIGNVETLKSISRPIMLANASMDSNISDLATLLGKWSTRYNFSSMAMEGLIDDIRGNTANNQATAQDTLENIAKLETWVGYYAEGNEDKMTQMSESISKGTSWLESMNVDTSRYTDYIEAIASGKAASDTQLVQVLGSVGLSAIDAQKMFASGDIDKLYEALFSGEVNIMSRVKGNGTNLIYQTLEAMGMDMSMVDAYSAAMSKNYTSLGDFEMTTSDITAAQSVEDQYVSLQEKTNNWLSDIYEVIANIQEHTGVGLSDLAGLYVLYKGTSSVVKNVASLFGVQGAGSVTGASLIRAGARSGGANLFGSGALAGTTGGLLGAGGILAGVGGSVYGISTGIDQAQAGQYGLATGNIAGGVAMGVGSASLAAGMLGVGATNAWNPLGWGLLLAGGATLAGTTIVESMDAISGASSSVEAQFEQLSSSFKAEQVDRINQLESLKEAIAATDDFEEATKLVSESGLVSLEGKSIDTTSELINMISSIQEASSSLMSLNDAALEAAEGIISDKASESDGTIKDTLKDYLVDAAGGKYGVLTKDDDNYYTIKQVFTQLAESITDETARNEALADVDKVFEDNALNYDEISFLTDTGGNLLAAGSLELDRKDNIFRQSRDLSKANAALSLLGISGYDLSAMEDVNQLSTIYSNWMKATTEDEKAEYVSQFAAIYRGLDDNLKSAYKNTAKEMGISSYAVGSNYITSDQLALVHEGEAIVPKRYNPMANLNELELLRERSKEDTREANDNITTNISEVVSALSDIQRFLSEWKKTSETRATVESQRSRFSTERASVSSYGASRSYTV